MCFTYFLPNLFPPPFFLFLPSVSRFIYLSIQVGKKFPAFLLFWSVVLDVDVVVVAGFRVGGLLVRRANYRVVFRRDSGFVDMGYRRPKK